MCPLLPQCKKWFFSTLCPSPSWMVIAGKHWQWWYTNICEIQILSNLIYLSRHLCCVHHHGIRVPEVMQWLSVRAVDKIQASPLPAPRWMLEWRSAVLLPISPGLAVPNFCPQSATFLLATLDTTKAPKPIYHSKWEAPLTACNPWDACPSSHRQKHVIVIQTLQRWRYAKSCLYQTYFWLVHREAVSPSPSWGLSCSLLRTGKQEHVQSQQKKHVLSLTAAQWKTRPAGIQHSGCK